MATIADDVKAINDGVVAANSKLDALAAAVAAIQTGGTTDLTSVLDAVADVRAQLSPTV